MVLLQILGTLALAIWLTLSTSISASVLNRPWCEWETAHFNIYTDLRHNDATQIANELLEFHYAANVLLSADTTRQTDVNIIIFRNAREFRRELKQTKFIGLMQPSLQEHKILLTTNLRDRAYTKIPFHEYTHHLIKQRIELPIPRWLEEGLAQYLETMVIENDTVEIGKIKRRRILNSLSAIKDLPWSEVLSLDLSHEDTPELSVKYDIAFGLIHYLIHGSQSSEFKPYERIVHLLNDVNLGTNATAKYLNLVNLDQSELFQALYKHFSKPQDLFTYTFTLPEKTVSFRDCLDGIDRDLLIVRSVIKFNLERANDILQRIERQFPGDHRVLSLLAEVHRHDAQLAIDYAKSAYRTKPDSLATNLALANAYVQLCVSADSQQCTDLLKQAETHYRKVLSIDHTRVDAAFGLGSVYLHRGRAGEALNYLRVAYKHSPWSVRVNLQLGEAHRQLGKLRAAEKYIMIAAKWDVNEQRRNLASKLLAQIQQQLENGQ